jgi:hypothetical protein
MSHRSSKISAGIDRVIMRHLRFPQRPGRTEPVKESLNRVFQEIGEVTRLSRFIKMGCVFCASVVVVISQDMARDIWEPASRKNIEFYQPTCAAVSIGERMYPFEENMGDDRLNDHVLQRLFSGVKAEFMSQSIAELREKCLDVFGRRSKVSLRQGVSEVLHRSTCFLRSLLSPERHGEMKPSEVVASYPVRLASGRGLGEGILKNCDQCKAACSTAVAC